MRKICKNEKRGKIQNCKMNKKWRKWKTKKMINEKE